VPWLHGLIVAHTMLTRPFVIVMVRRDALTAGSSAVVVVRPEQVRIEPTAGGVAETADNVVAGSLTDTTAEAPTG